MDVSEHVVVVDPAINKYRLPPLTKIVNFFGVEYYRLGPGTDDVAHMRQSVWVVDRTAAYCRWQPRRLTEIWSNELFKKPNTHTTGALSGRLASIQHINSDLKRFTVRQRMGCLNRSDANPRTLVQSHRFGVVSRRHSEQAHIHAGSFHFSELVAHVSGLSVHCHELKDCQKGERAGKNHNPINTKEVVFVLYKPDSDVDGHGEYFGLVLFALLLMTVGFIAGDHLILSGWRRTGWTIAYGCWLFLMASLALFRCPCLLAGRCLCEPDGERQQQHGNHRQNLHAETVTQKLVDEQGLAYYIISMANILSLDKQAIIIGSLTEGSSIRSIERMTGVHRDTIMRLGVKVGQGCAKIQDAIMRDLPCTHLQMDEIWGYIGKKQRHVAPSDDASMGDAWTFCAIDTDTKLVPAFKVGKRDSETANAFVADVASRMRNRVQLSSDGLAAYAEAVELAFGSEVDYAQVIKTYSQDNSNTPERRYSPASVLTVEKRVIQGDPDMKAANTSYVERLNATTRQHMRRLTRLTHAFSKKLENFEAAVALHFAYYNLVKRHETLRCTPAMAAEVVSSAWTVRQLVEVATA